MFVHAFANTTVANALFTLSAIPFITAILAFYFLNENLSIRTIIIMIIAFAGIVLMISEGLALGEFFGNIMALGTALFFSCFAITLRKFRKLDMLPTLLIAGLMVSWITLIMTYNFIKIPVNEMFLCFIWGGVLSGVVNLSLIHI